MKKILAMLLCALLALTLFAACNKGGGEEEDPSAAETEVATEQVDATLASTDEAEATSEDITGPAVDDATTADATAGNGDADPLAPPANLNTLSKEEQLAYFNLVANRVRTDKPGFKQDYSKIISDLTFTGIVKAVQSIIDKIVSDLTGADPTATIAKGNGNDGKFLSELTPFELKAADVTSISSAQNGSNWVIKVNIIQETNPAKPSGSANARAYPIASRQEVLDEITGVSNLIKADPNNASLRYNSGTISLTVNEKGQVTAGSYSFKANATANNVKISFISTNVTAIMTVNSKYFDFVW